MTTLSALPLNQIAFSVVDLRRTEAWWCDGLGFLPAGGSRLMMRGPLSASIVDLPGAAPLGRAGARRVCVRNPDGVYVELLEQDPLPEESLRGRQDCPVAIRYVSMTTPDLAAFSALRARARPAAARRRP